MLSDAFASDDSDMRNTAHIGTCVTSAGMAIAERTGATGQDLLTAMIVGYEAAGRIGDARRGGRPGVHASQTVAFAGAVTAGRLLKLTDEQLAHAIGITAITMGGLSIGTNSWAREYMGGNAAFCAVNAALAAGRGYTVNDDILEAQGGFLTVYGGAPGPDGEILTRDYGKEWDITKYLAIKLWPGAHPFSSLVEAAMTAARRANVPASDVARILVHGRGVGGSRNPKDYAEAIHSLPYFLACAVADKDFTWIHATPAKFRDPAIARLMGLVEADRIGRSGQVPMGLGRHGHGRDHVGRAVHEHDRRAARVRPARHRMERRRRQVPRADAGFQIARGAHRGKPQGDPRLRAGQADVRVDEPDRWTTLAIGNAC